MANEVKIGSYTGTGAAINLELGWIPDYILVENATDGDESWSWFYGMTNAHALKIASDGTKTRITSNGISAYEPADLTNAVGVTFGSALSESGDTFRYVAMRNSAGG